MNEPLIPPQLIGTDPARDDDARVAPDGDLDELRDEMKRVRPADPAVSPPVPAVGQRTPTESLPDTNVH